MNTQKQQDKENAESFGGLKRSGKAARDTAHLKFSELDDLFLKTKGRILRNLNKKLTKHNDLLLQVKKGEIEPNAQQKEQIASIPGLKEEIKELQDLCDLYIKSNPNYENKQEAQVDQQEVAQHVEDALRILANAQVLKSLSDEDSSYVEATSAERASLNAVLMSFDKMVEDAKQGSQSIQDDQYRNDFVE